MKLQELGGGCGPRTELVTTQQLLDQCAKKSLSLWKLRGPGGTDRTPWMQGMAVGMAGGMKR